MYGLFRNKSKNPSIYRSFMNFFGHFNISTFFENSTSELTANRVNGAQGMRDGLVQSWKALGTKDFSKNVFSFILPALERIPWCFPKFSKFRKQSSNCFEHVSKFSIISSNYLFFVWKYRPGCLAWKRPIHNLIYIRHVCLEGKKYT